ncbi:MAG: GNAT family N-acetyltransferase [Endomicrobia bacterium]|nr:GNAT family N-acetyltransferase [Endomicrobiia bacterium]
MKILKAENKDLPEIYKLQKEAYISEAEIHNNYSIQPLTQTLEEAEKEFDRGIVLKAVNEDGKITGSVRGFTDGGTLYIGKLMVHPDFQNKGIGKKLLSSIEELFPDLRYELFTSTKSDKNLAVYTKSGYKEFKREYMPDGVDFVYMEKNTK